MFNNSVCVSKADEHFIREYISEFRKKWKNMRFDAVRELVLMKINLK